MLKKLKGKRLIGTMVTLVGVTLLATAIVVAGCGGGLTTITSAGSTTVQPVAEKLANAFMAEHQDVKVVIQGGGSSTGVKSANEGTVDIGMASRELKQSELGYGLAVHVLARDGIAIVTHTSNSVEGLTMEQVREIYAGTITNWNQVGGDDKGIIVVAREEGSGTRAAFEEMVMDEQMITGNAILQPSNGAVKTTVSTTPYSVGFLSFGYLDSSVRSLAIDGVEGTVDNAIAGTYPIVRPLLLLTKGAATGEVKNFIDYCLSSEGQDIVESEGYIRVD